ncbi:four helix bundle protein [Halomonas ventosae]|uniref:four helix bundle protein n=1 Tax=Halomonas ventosae TaxID=229007 RepID=UPI002158A1E4|nr:four helix bundle protein [Halomonas ventosae]
MRKHESLRAWQLAMALVEDVYRVTVPFPDTERFGLTSQLRRAAISVPSNIAEGAARGSTTDFTRFLYIARGSLSEVDTQLQIAQRLGFIQDTQLITERIDQVFAQLGGLIKHLKARINP